MDSNPQQSPVQGSNAFRPPVRHLTRRVRLAHAGRAALVAACAVVLAGALTLADQRRQVAAAPGDGTVKPSPQSGLIIQNHVVGIPVVLTTCADGTNTLCRLGAFDLTLNFSDPLLDIVTEGAIGTSGTTTTLTVATATWKLDQWKGSQVHITSGPGFGQKRVILTNTATTLTVATPWNAPPASQPGSGSIFNIGGMSDGGFIGSSGRTVNCQLPEYGASWAQIECFTLGSEIPGPNGAGTITNLVVRAVNRGLSTLSLTNVQVLPIEGEPITPVDVFGGTRRVILCPDPNGDGRITSIDLGLIAQQFGKTNGQPGYTTTRDPNEDNVISSIDLGLTAQVFNKRCVQP